MTPHRAHRRARGRSLRTGPDDLCCRAIDAGGRSVLPDLRLWIGADSRRSPNRSVNARCYPNIPSVRANQRVRPSRPGPRPGPAASPPRAPAGRPPRRRPVTGPATSISSASAPSWTAESAAVRVGTATGRPSAFHAARVSVLVNASSAAAAVRTLQQHGGHVARLVPRQAVRPRLDLAEDRHHRHQQAGGAEGGQHVRIAGLVGGVPLQRGGQPRRGLAGVVGVVRPLQQPLVHPAIVALWES